MLKGKRGVAAEPRHGRASRGNRRRGVAAGPQHGRATSRNRRRGGATEPRHGRAACGNSFRGVRQSRGTEELRAGTAAGEVTVGEGLM